MKKGVLVLSAFFTFVSFSDETDPGKKLPSVLLKDIAGNTINTAEISNDGKPIIIAFWASWCKICKLELNTIAEEYESWQKETGVKIVAVSVDDQKTVNSVEAIVNTAGWEYDIWMDTNGNFKRAMGVSHTPHWFLLDENKNIIYSHNNFVPGDENLMYEKIRSVAND